MAPWLSPAAPKRVSGELRLSDGAETASSVAGAYCLITPDALLTRWYPANFLRWGNRIFTVSLPCQSVSSQTRGLGSYDQNLISLFAQSISHILHGKRSLESSPHPQPVQDV